MTTVGYDLYPKVRAEPLIMKQQEITMRADSDFLRSSDRRFLRLDGSVHPDPAHPHRGQQLRQLLQEQALEERGGPEEAGDHSANC